MAEDLTTTDWSQVGWLEQPIYNSGDETISVLISLEDTAKGWWQRAVEIPPRVPLLLRVPMDEARLSVDPGHIQRWLLGGRPARCSRVPPWHAAAGAGGQEVTMAKIPAAGAAILPRRCACDGREGPSRRRHDDVTSVCFLAEESPFHRPAANRVGARWCGRGRFVQWD